MKRDTSWPATEAGPKASDSEGLTLHLEKVLLASPEEVFDACIDPAKLTEWWGPAGLTFSGLGSTLATAGATGSRCSRPREKDTVFRGEFREIDRPRHLVYTFVWEDQTPTTRRRW